MIINFTLHIPNNYPLSGIKITDNSNIKNAQKVKYKMMLVTSL